MTIFIIFRDWWSKPMPEPDSEPQEVWQWQLNCIGRGYPPNRMPQTFGLLIGRRADAEARLEASVSLTTYCMVSRHKYSHEGLIIYEFSEPEQDGTPHTVMQMGAIRCVSRDRKLIRSWAGAPIPPRSDAPFIVEEKPNLYLNDFTFHPIKPQEEFIKGERNDAG